MDLSTSSAARVATGVALARIIDRHWMLSGLRHCQGCEARRSVHSGESL